MGLNAKHQNVNAPCGQHGALYRHLYALGRLIQPTFTSWHQSCRSFNFQHFNSAGFNNAYNIQRSAPTLLRKNCIFWYLLSCVSQVTVITTRDQVNSITAGSVTSIFMRDLFTIYKVGVISSADAGSARYKSLCWLESIVDSFCGRKVGYVTVKSVAVCGESRAC